MKNLQLFLVLLLAHVVWLQSEQIPVPAAAQKSAKTEEPVAQKDKTVSEKSSMKKTSAKKASVVAKKAEKKAPVVKSVAKQEKTTSAPKPIQKKPITEDKPAAPVATKTVPEQVAQHKIVIQAAPSTTKLPLQINIKNNAKSEAHITGFSVVYQGKTVQANNVYSSLASGEEKHHIFNLKVPYDKIKTINYPYVSEIVVDGQTVATNYEQSPIGHTLQVLQITKKKNGLWGLDTKAMKKAQDLVVSQNEADQSGSVREGIITKVAKARSKKSVKVKKEVSLKRKKQSKASASGQKAVNGSI